MIAVNESMRVIDGKSTKAIDRANYRIVQTPQCFESEILKKAYEQEYNSEFTDDASIVEKSGVTIYTVQGNSANIKITTKADLLYAEQMLK